MSKPVEISLDDIRFDGGTQARESINWVQVQEYQKMLKDGVEFDPISLLKDPEGNLWAWDGAHRFEAHKKEGRERILASVKPGTLDDAVLAAAGANTKHGLARTQADKQRSVDMVLKHGQCTDWGDRKIARHTNTSHTFVAQRRAALASPDLAGKKQPVPRQKREKKKDRAPDDTALALMADTEAGQDQEQVKKLAQLPPEEQFEVASRIAEGEAESVDEARAQIFIQAQPKLFDVFTSEEEVVAKYGEIQAKEEKKSGKTILASIHLVRSGTDKAPKIYAEIEKRDALNGNMILEDILSEAKNFINMEASGH